jgi:hypothetical protein
LRIHLYPFRYGISGSDLPDHYRLVKDFKDKRLTSDKQKQALGKALHAADARVERLKDVLEWLTSKFISYY